MKNLRLFGISILLASPLIFFLIHQYVAHSPELIPTGFIQDDDVVYIANARQYLEGKPALTYSNPFSYSAASPAIYSQPYNFILCFFLSFYWISPGLILTIFGIVSAVFCIYFSIKLVEYLYPHFKQKNIV